ncbi:MAG: glycosyltransferase family 1 protein [Chlorobiaceae bacterium]|nr:glycosyltransferase family 1 protein [Chlorobiaceae bacterium]
MKKKILFLVNHEIVIYNFRKELVEELLSKNYEVYISSPSGEKIDELKRMGCIHLETNLSRHGKNPLQDLKLLMHYMRLMKENKPDLILTYTIKPNIYGSLAAKFSRTPCISNITGLGTALENVGILQMVTRILYKLSSNRVNKIYFQNEENMNFFLKHKILKSSYKLIPGSGVNISHFKHYPYPSEDDGIEFAFISRIMKEKGIEEYLSAAKEIKLIYPNTQFHVCGFCEQRYEETLRNAEKAGLINYHGMLKDIREITKRVHCIVHPSYYPEGMSNVLLEGGASGRAIITTTRSGCRETVDNEINGYLVEPKNTVELVEAIKKFMNLTSEERLTMGNKSRNKMVSEFNRNIIIEEYLKEINEIII